MWSVLNPPPPQHPFTSMKKEKSAIHLFYFFIWLLCEIIRWGQSPTLIYFVKDTDRGWCRSPAGFASPEQRTECTRAPSSGTGHMDYRRQYGGPEEQVDFNEKRDRPMMLGSKERNPSIFYTAYRSGSWGTWSRSQVARGTGRGTRWTGCQVMAGHIQSRSYK